MNSAPFSDGKPRLTSQALTPAETCCIVLGMDVLERASRRRVARKLLMDAIAMLDPADGQAMLEDALVQMYETAGNAGSSATIGGAADAVASDGGGNQEQDQGAAVEADASLATRIMAVVKQDPARIYSVAEISGTLGQADRQLVRGELSRLKRRKLLQNKGRGLYQVAPTQNGEKRRHA